MNNREILDFLNAVDDARNRTGLREGLCIGWVAEVLGVAPPTADSFIRMRLHKARLTRRRSRGRPPCIRHDQERSGCRHHCLLRINRCTSRASTRRGPTVAWSTGIPQGREGRDHGLPQPPTSTRRCAVDKPVLFAGEFRLCHVQARHDTSSTDPACTDNAARSKTQIQLIHI